MTDIAFWKQAAFLFNLLSFPYHQNAISGFVTRLFPREWY